MSANEKNDAKYTTLKKAALNVVLQESNYRKHIGYYWLLDLLPSLCHKISLRNQYAFPNIVYVKTALF